MMDKKIVEVAKAVMGKTFEVQAKDEKAAVAKMNKMMKDPEGYGFKVMKSKGYYGKYKLVKTFKNRSTGSEYCEFNLQKKEDGVYCIGKPWGGYYGQD